MLHVRENPTGLATPVAVGAAPQLRGPWRGEECPGWNKGPRARGETDHSPQGRQQRRPSGFQGQFASRDTSWPASRHKRRGLSRPSTSWPRRKTWIPGTRLHKAGTKWCCSTGKSSLAPGRGEFGWLGEKASAARTPVDANFVIPSRHHGLELGVIAAIPTSKRAIHASLSRHSLATEGGRRMATGAPQVAASNLPQRGRVAETTRLRRTSAPIGARMVATYPGAPATLTAGRSRWVCSLGSCSSS